MLIILSPSKTQALTFLPHAPHEQPLFSKQTAGLMEDLLKLSQEDLRKRMKLSSRLAESVYRHIRQFRLPHTPETAGTALATFQGDAFSALSAVNYNTSELLFAQQHIRILSGLYGALRPLDLIQLHRLEMATKGISARAHNLYEVWSECITRHLSEEMSRQQNPVVINCASAEYSRAISRKKLSGPMIDIIFKQYKAGAIKTVPIFAKRARGMFVDWFIRNRIDHPERLTDFASGGYRFAKELCGDDNLVFVAELD